MAAVKVFSIPELLERILTFSSSFDLVMAGMVSTEFKNGISSSSILQKRSFLAAEEGNAYPRRFNGCIFYKYIDTDCEPKDYARFRFQDPYSVFWLPTHFGVRHSCLDMFVSQPPIKSVYLVWHLSKGIIRKLIEQEDGVRLGDVLQSYAVLVQAGRSIELETAEMNIYGWQEEL